MKTQYVILFLSIIFFSACQKELTNPDAQQQQTTNFLDTFSLKKFIVLDTTLAVPNDTLFIYQMQYDNSGRCTNLLARAVGFGNDTFSIKNYYNGNDTIISKRKLYDYTSLDSTIEYFTYNNAGIMLKDSVLEYTSTLGLTKFLFDYTGINNLGGIITNKSNGLPFENNTYILQKDGNANITYENDSMFLYNSTTNNFNFVNKTVSTISYDNKLNPFYKIFPKFLVENQSEGSTMSNTPPFCSIPQKNNPVANVSIITPLPAGGENCDATYTYTYNSSNYPTKVIIKDNLNNKFFKGIFVY